VYNPPNQTRLRYLSKPNYSEKSHLPNIAVQR
jgi:hypothetical protein